MKILCLIPAKKYSSRLANKNFFDIEKKAFSRMDNHFSKKIKLFNEIIVSSDDDKILKLPKKIFKNFLKKDQKNFEKEY